MIELDGLTKAFRGRVAVDDLTVTVEPGRVTGFLGPNGSGKTTTMRCVLGLTRPTAGTANVLGRAFRDLPDPMRRVGALIDPRARHPGRSAYAHLQVLAQSNGLPRRRVDDVVDLVGLEAVAGDRVGSFSLGMGQRLGIAAALLGDPEVLLLDEPVNGLDPEGIRWVRELLRDLADEGRTVLVSSHLMSEMEDTADHLVVVGRGRLLADVPISDLLAAHATVRVASPSAVALATALHRAGGRVERESTDTLRVAGLDAATVGDVAFEAGLRLHELTRVTASLEQAYLELTRDAVDYRAVDYRTVENRAVENRTVDYRAVENPAGSP